jgi:hypothetical protein
MSSRLAGRRQFDLAVKDMLHPGKQREDGDAALR